MRKISLIILFINVFFVSSFAQNNLLVNRGFTNTQLNKDIKDSTTQDSINNESKNLNERKRLWFEAGINVSGFQNVGSEERIGYAIGLTNSHKLYNLIDIDISVLVSRQSIFLKGRKGTGSDGEFVYRIFYDHYISILFIDIPVMINYRLWSNNSTTFQAGLGIGYSISVKDYSERINFVNTGEILDIPIPVDEYYIEDSVFDNSGIHVNAGIWYNYNSIMIKFLYINKRYDLKRIDMNHTFSVHLGYHLN